MTSRHGVRRITLAAALAGALPTLVYAIWSPALMVDDWSFAAGARFHQWGTFHANAGRPVAGGWFLLDFLVFGAHPVAHAVVLALLNGAAGGLLWLTARTFLPQRIALLATAAWAALANRGSTRLWPATAPSVLVLVALLAVTLLARHGDPSARRHAAVVAIAATSVLTYEGAAGLAVAVVVLSAWRWSGRARLAALTGGGTVLATVAAWGLAQSPKTGATEAFGHGAQWLSAQVGVGILPATLAPVGAALLGFVVWSAAATALPSFRAGAEERAALIGAAIAMLGVAPFLAVGFPVATDGIFDRANLYADVGTALVIAAALAKIWRLPLRRLGPVVAVVALAVLAVQNAIDVRAFHRAGVDGRALLARVDRLPFETRTKGPLVLPDLPNRQGVSMFIEDYDISSALALRYDTGAPYPDATMALVASRHRAR
ncbi:MAG: hypothetical protein QOE35_3176 [Actinomycetota bacterium]